MASPLNVSEAPTTGIGKLIADNRFYVPTHQRDYKWDRERVEKFFDDLTAALERRDKLYFVGLMVFMRDDDGRLRVLDGQQRLATTIIAFSALRSWFGPDNSQDNLSSRLQYDFIGRTEYGDAHPTSKMKLNLNNDDLFQTIVVQGRELQGLRDRLRRTNKTDSNYPLLDAISYAHDRIASIAKTQGEGAQAYFSNLIKFMRDQVIVVRLTVPNESNAFKVFETLNDRGLDLSAMDLVKNHLFGLAYSQSAETLRQMEHRWSQLSDTLKDAKQDDFLKVYWVSRHGLAYTDDLFDGFKNAYKTAAEAEDASQDMLEAAEHFAALRSSKDVVWAPYSDRCRQLIDELGFLGNKLIRPVVLAALKKTGSGKIEPAELEGLLWLLLVIIVRWQIVRGGRPGVIERTCARLALAIWKGEVSTTDGALGILAEPYQTDDDFRQYLLSYENATSSKTRYLLRKIEERERTIKLGASGRELRPDEKLTLEHILPKKSAVAWRELVASDPSIVEECAERFGNLCLLGEGRNKDADQQGWDQKKPFYASSDIVTTNALAEIETWNRTMIEHRQARLAKRAVEIWRVPP